MKSLCLTITRFAIAAWVGAAIIFVVTAIQEVRYSGFDSEIKSSLASIRFPTYYVFGFGLVIIGLISGFFARGHQAVGAWRMRAFLGLMVIVLAIMLYDYVWIYHPLAIMNEAPARSAKFHEQHRKSMYINSVHVGLSLLAAVIICWPGSKRVSDLPMVNGGERESR